MKVSIVVCTYTMERYDDFVEAVESALDQTYEPIEVVLVSDGNTDVADHMREDFGHHGNVRVHCTEENRGISHVRTRGAEVATGELVAFLDDDAVAEPDWIEQLVETFRSTDAVAVGGRLAADWLVERPSFFPEEFYWLVGVTEKGFADHLDEVRNTYGSNIAYDREAFLSVGGYDEETGRKGDRHVQAHEAPACIRIREEYGRGVIYNENAVVYHKLFDYRGEFTWLVKRAFWQGYSKRVMNKLYPDEDGNEGDYLRTLFLRYIPERLKRIITSPSRSEIEQLVSIFVFTAAVGFGFLYGLLTYR